MSTTLHFATLIAAWAADPHTCQFNFLDRDTNVKIVFFFGKQATELSLATLDITDRSKPNFQSHFCTVLTAPMHLATRKIRTGKLDIVFAWFR